MKRGRGVGVVGNPTAFWRLITDMPRFLASDRVQAAIAAIAADQHGVITTHQLLAAGSPRPESQTGFDPVASTASTAASTPSGTLD